MNDEFDRSARIARYREISCKLINTQSGFERVLINIQISKMPDRFLGCLANSPIRLVIFSLLVSLHVVLRFADSPIPRFTHSFAINSSAP